MNAINEELNLDKFDDSDNESDEEKMEINFVF